VPFIWLKKNWYPKVVELIEEEIYLFQLWGSNLE
jgi:hypothetical protein